MIKILKKFFVFSGPENRKKLQLSLFLNAIEAFALALRIPAIYLIADGMINKTLTLQTVLFSFGLLVLGIVIQMIISGKSKMLQTEAGYLTCASKRMEIALHLRYLPMGYFNKNSLGSITSITTNTMEGLADIATRVVMMTTQGIINASLIAVYLLFFDWRIGIITVIGIIFFFITNSLIQRKSEALSHKKVEADTKIVEEVLEYIQGIAEIKNYNIGRSNEKANRAIDRASDINIEMEMSFVPLISLQNWLIKMCSIAILCSSLYFYLNHTMTLSVAVVMIISSFMIFNALDSAGGYSALLRVTDLSMNRANEILELKPMDINGQNIIPESYDIAMENVDFSYHTKKIINNINLSIKEHTTAAFVGPSGGGKTTLCHLAARFWDVNQGRVTLDHRNVKNYSMDSLMKNYSFVFQNVYLFHDTIANNIKFGQDDAGIEEVIRAAKKARCHEFIMSLPQGYDTVIGEGGDSLSGGEKQRLSIARAIMKDAPIIILDEATANVDPENEKELIEAIYELTKEKTILMIAHRLKTVRHADCIFVIDKGQIIQKGTHEELIKEEGLYKKFIESRVEAISWKIQ